MEDEWVLLWGWLLVFCLGYEFAGRLDVELKALRLVVELVLLKGFLLVVVWVVRMGDALGGLWERG